MQADELRAALSRHFGHGGFRPGQEAVVRSVLSGRPTIAILPTGGGKSLCYQLPALLFEGTTVVVSPLVALMKDQVDALRARGIPAAFVNSSLTESERAERQGALRRGELKLVYVAPERFRSPSFLSAMSGVRVPLLAVDEAHCISSWGHDFRPEYQRIAQARTQLGAERLLALTATATPEVRRDIAQALELRDPKVFVAGFDRPNLFIEVLKVAGDADKLGRLLALSRGGTAGIVYAGTRRNVEKACAALRAGGVDAVEYHAGLDDAHRTRVQDQFVRGKARVIVATNAFGMGVDKPDIRFVAHFDVPRSLEAYYQEIGRAGRDGQDSYALLLFNWADVMMQRRIIESGRPSRELVAAIWRAARRLRSGSLDELARACGKTAGELSSAVRLLESAGHLERARDAGSSFAVASRAAEDELGIDFDLLETRVERERQMLDRLVRFTDTRGCRRQNLLRYFGDPDAPSRCAACEGCIGSRAPEAEAVAARKRARGARTAAAPGGGPEEPFDESVFEKLRTLRTVLAREAGVPPYVVFHDATLRELARALPADEAAFLRVKGAGPARWEKYGPRVVAITRAVAPSPAPRSVAPRTAPPPSAPPSRERAPRVSEPVAWEPPGWMSDVPPSGSGPREDAGAVADARLLELCGSGRSLAEIAAESGRPASELASLLAASAHAGRRLDTAALLGADRLAAMRAAAARAGGDLVAARKLLPFPAALAEIRLAVLAG